MLLLVIKSADLKCQNLGLESKTLLQKVFMFSKKVNRVIVKDTIYDSIY